MTDRATSMADAPIFTIGHSNHSREAFLALLSKHGVTVVADVRSAPYSRFSPHFDRDALASALEARGVHYAFLGRTLGGRPTDPDCYEDGRVRYDRAAGTAVFRSGIERVVEMAADRRVALMCAEKEPLDCHRTLLVAQALDGNGREVAHIHADGGLEPHAAAMDRLMAKFGLNPDGDLFGARAESVARAVARQAGRVAFVKPPGERVR